MKKTKLSQSLLKRLKHHFEGNDCGTKIVAEAIEKTVKKPTSESAMAGIRFEFLATRAESFGDYKGNEPLLTPKTGKPSAQEKVVQAQVENWKNMVKDFGIEVLETSYLLQYEYESFIHKGYADVLCKINNYHYVDNDGITQKKPPHLAIIDIKFSGLFDDKFSKWGWHVDKDYHILERKEWAKSLENKGDLTIQPVDYKCIYEAVENKDIEFYFAIFHAKDAEKFKMVNVQVSEQRKAKHMNEVAYFAQKLNNELEIGLLPKPRFDICEDCLVKDCEFRVFYNTENIKLD